MARPRKSYTAEFKVHAVRMVTDQKLSVAEAARRLGVGENLLRLWKKAFLDRGTEAFPGHGRLSPAASARAVRLRYMQPRPSRRAAGRTRRRPPRSARRSPAGRRPRPARSNIWRLLSAAIIRPAP